MNEVESLLPRLGFALAVIGALLLNFFSPPLQLLGGAIFLLGLLYPMAELAIQEASRQWKRLATAIRYWSLRRNRQRYLSKEGLCRVLHPANPAFSGSLALDKEVGEMAMYWEFVKAIGERELSEQTSSVVFFAGVSGEPPQLLSLEVPRGQAGRPFSTASNESYLPHRRQWGEGPLLKCLA